jgi:Tfp pilus assembly protein PilO
LSFEILIMPIVGYKFYGRNIRPYLEGTEKKSYTILGMTLFSLVVFGAFAIRPSLATISRLRQEVKEARAAEEILNQKINNLSQAQVNYQLVLKDIDLVSQSLPREESVPAILEMLSLAAGRNNVVLEGATFGSVEGEGELKKLILTIGVVGDFASSRNFIAELESGVRQMDVRDVGMVRSEGNLVSEIKLVAYFYE